MKCSRRAFTALLSTLVLLWASTRVVSAADGNASITLSRNGTTDYAIVIARDAREAEAYAAKELASFLEKMTGAVFPITRDDTAPSDLEIVLGDTNRRKLSDLPPHLRARNLEAFAIVREGKRLLIMGNIPRGTLYGVYDFLDVELGVRFLAHQVNHVPRKPTLEVPVASRVYWPPFEKRTIWQGNPMGNATVRNRLNGVGFQVANERMLGGVKMVGRPTHSYSAFVPQEEYFADHPEYFAFVDGRRRAQYKGMPTQLCVTNPDVLRISRQMVLGWLEEAREANPYNKYVVSVSAHDSIFHCRCEPCTAINREEGVENGGPHVRFLNAIAHEVAREFPHASVQTMFYHMDLPKKTKAAPNVILQHVTGINWRYALDDMSQFSIRRMNEAFAKWQKAAGDGHQYVWTKHQLSFSDYFKPSPNLRYLARNARIMSQKYAVTGWFAQNGQSAGVELQTIRYYLLARAMWRPQNDSRDEIEDFCHLYYGKAARNVLHYINYLHNDYGEHVNTGYEEDEHRVLTRKDRERYIEIADAILSAAEAEVSSPDLKLRVATLRLPVWKTILNHAFADAQKDSTYVPTDQVRAAGRRFIEVGRAVRLTHLSESYGGRNAQTERSYYPQIRELLRRGLPADPAEPWITDDAGLAEADLSRARRLDLCGSKVTDAGLAHLRGLSQLKSLDLSYTQVTDEGLAHLEDLENLAELRLGGEASHVGDKITDRGIHHLRKMNKLTKLSIGGTKASNDSVAVILGMPRMTHLEVWQTGVNDEGLADLAKLTTLEHLDVAGVWIPRRKAVTDAGLVHLRGLENLKYLNLYDTPVTDDAVEALTRARPQLHVRRY
jgi:hypothetical protein